MTVEGLLVALVAALIPIVWIGGAVAISRDVHRKGGRSLLTLVLAFLFWPGAVYLWGYTRGVYHQRTESSGAR